jgi:hypothetical protein
MHYLPLIMSLSVLQSLLRKRIVSTRRLRRGRMCPWHPRVALLSVRGLFTDLFIILPIVHLSSKASSSHLSDMLPLFPIHISRIPLVFAHLLHRIITTHVTIVGSLVTFLRIAHIQSSSTIVLRGRQ